LTGEGLRRLLGTAERAGQLRTDCLIARLGEVRKARVGPNRVLRYGK